MDTVSIKQIIDFFHQAGNLKESLRFSKIKDMPKNTATDHSWRTSLMCFVLADNLKLNIDLEKVLKIAIIHDIVEAVVGNTDYISLATGKISKQEQQEKEKHAITKLGQTLPNNSGKKIIDMWMEFEKNITREAKYVKAVNKLETLLYLLEVGHKYYDDPELILSYADESVKEFPELNNTLQFVKNELKEEIKKI